MFRIKKQKNSFKFYSSLPAVTKEFPIIESKSFKRNWIRPVAESYKSITSDIKNFGIPFSGAIKCPGIFSAMNTGWILTSWFDFIIETKNNGESCSFKIPPFLKDEVKFSNYNQPLISFMNLNLPTMKIPVPNNSLDILIKITTPWAVEIPKGWNLLVLPVSYSDDVRFTASTGILKPGDREINPQLFWHQGDGTELVEAGTPLCQLIPIPDNQVNFDFDCLDYDENQKKEQARYSFKNVCRFITK